MVLSSPDRRRVSRHFPAGGTAKFFNKSEFCELEVLNHLVTLSEWKTQTRGAISQSQQHASQRYKVSLYLIFYPVKVQEKKKRKVKTYTHVIN